MAIHTSTNNDDKEQHEKLQALAAALGLGHYQTEIDSLKDNIQYIKGKLEELINAWNETTKQAQAQPMVATPIPTSSALSLLGPQEKMSLVKELAASVKEVLIAWKDLRGSNSPTTILEPEIINEHLRKSMLGNFEVGEALTDSLKSKIVSKSMGKVINEIITHEPA